MTNETCIAHHHYEGKGRPKKEAVIQLTQWQVTADIEMNELKKQQRIDQKPCFVLATNTDKNTLGHKELLQRYKAQSHVERGFQFLKEPLFFCVIPVYQKAKSNRCFVDDYDFIVVGVFHCPTPIKSRDDDS